LIHWGVVGDLPFQNNENVIVHWFRMEMPSRPKRKAAKADKLSFKDVLKAQDEMMRHDTSKPKHLSSSKIRMKGPGHCLSTKYSKDIPSNKIVSDKQNSGPRTFESTKTRKNIHTSNSTIVLKNEDDISAFLVQAFSKGRCGKRFTQI
jgi:hypothetical protein